MIKILLLVLFIQGALLHKLSEDEFEDLFETSPEEEQILK